MNSIFQINWTLVILLAAGIAFCIALFRRRGMASSANRPFSFSSVLILSAGVSAICYFAFYRAAPFFWSINSNLPAEECCHASQDPGKGIELYVLYAWMFLNVFLSLAIYEGLLRIRSAPAFNAGVILFFLAAIFWAWRIGFHLPSPVPPNMTIKLFAGLLVVGSALGVASRKGAGAFLVTSMLILLPVCFIAREPISLADDGYVFGPALRWLKGFSISQIYCQYDWLMSFIALPWIKWKFSLATFTLAGEVATYAFIAGASFLAWKMFHARRLAIFLLISLALVKCYVVLDPSNLIQVTSLRLDLWIILVALVYLRGASHWSVGLALAGLMVLHRSFGMIYAAAYLELVFGLFLLRFIERITPEEKDIRALAKEFLGRHAVNGCLLAASVLAGCFLFGGVMNKSAFIFLYFNLGFMRIAPASFYWHIPVLFGVTTILLFKLKDRISPRYWETAFFILLLAIGNSLYFFGRSHENNILNISGILLLLFFIFLDLLTLKTDSVDPPSAIQKTAVAVIPLFFVFLVAGSYGPRISNKIVTQYYRWKEGRWISPVAFKADFPLIRKETGESGKLYFLSVLDFYYYHYGNYTPMAYFHPHTTWMLRRDLTVFLQELLDRDYILVDDDGALDSLKEFLVHNRLKRAGPYQFMSNVKSEPQRSE